MALLVEAVDGIPAAEQAAGVDEKRESKPSVEHHHEDELEEDYHPHGASPAKFATADEEPEGDPDDFVEETSRDSFPGSDAPAW